MPRLKISHRAAAGKPLSLEAAPAAKNKKRLKAAEGQTACPPRKSVGKKFHAAFKGLRKIFHRRVKAKKNDDPAQASRKKDRADRPDKSRRKGNVFSRAIKSISHARRSEARAAQAPKQAERKLKDYTYNEAALPMIAHNPQIEAKAMEQAAMPLPQLKKEIEVLLTQELIKQAGPETAENVFRGIAEGRKIGDVFPDFAWKEEFATFDDAHDFAAQMEDQQLQIANLALKLEEGTASDADRVNMSELLHAAQSDLKIAQTHLGNMLARHVVRANAPGKELVVPAIAITQGLASRFAVHHMVIADMASKYGAALPPAEITRSADITHRSLRDSQGMLNALKMNQKNALLGENKTVASAITRLEAHCTELEQKLAAHKKAAAGQDDGSIRLSDKLTKADVESFDPGLDPSLMPDEQMIASGRKKAINDAAWPPIENNISIYVDGQAYNYKSTTTPGSSGVAQRFARIYEGGIAEPGDDEFFHAPNLAQSRLQAEDGRSLFQTIRHSALNPSGITPAFLKSLDPEPLRDLLQNMYLNEGMEGEEANLPALAFSISSQKDEKELQPICTVVQNNIRKTMAQEVIAASLIANEGKYEEALAAANFDDKYDPQTESEKVVSLPINAISLMTPSPSHMQGSERAILAGQLEALRAASHHGEIFKLPLRTPEGAVCFAPVKVDLRAFNFGVDSPPRVWRGVSLENVPLPPPLLRHVTGWGYSTPLNNSALTDLLGKRGDDYLGGAVKVKMEALEAKVHQLTSQRENLLRIDPDLKGRHSSKALYEIESEIKSVSSQGDRIVQCATQIKEIWRDGKFRSAGGEPNKMVARLALLCDAMDETPSISDMNGLDRVNRCDAEAKHLAAAFDSTGTLPEPDQGGNEAQRALFELRSGGAELRRYNDGLPG